MPNEFLSLCNCRLVAQRRENDEVVAEFRCKIEREEGLAEAPGAGEGEAGSHELRARLLRQAAQPLPGGGVLLNR